MMKVARCSIGMDSALQYPGQQHGCQLNGGLAFDFSVLSAVLCTSIGVLWLHLCLLAKSSQDWKAEGLFRCSRCVQNHHA